LCPFDFKRSRVHTLFQQKSKYLVLKIDINFFCKMRRISHHLQVKNSGVIEMSNFQVRSSFFLETKDKKK